MLLRYHHLQLNSLLDLAGAEVSSRAEAASSSVTSKRLLYPADERIKVALFCGGRGCASIVRELIRWPQIEATLLVNAYDDGLSTGDLREFIPNMLGPSDFRKNLSRLLDPSSNCQHALQNILEYRLPADFSAAHAANLLAFSSHPRSERYLLPDLRVLFRELDAEMRHQIVTNLSEFFRYYQGRQNDLKLAGCSFGNLIFAGCYLSCSQDFNTTVQRLATLFRSQARLVNVSRGENRTLAALKADGEVLNRESQIVGPQSEASIIELFFLERPLTSEEMNRIATYSLEAKRAFLQQLSRPVEISQDAEDALLAADIILYGPGTQFSSLLPSYRIAAQAIRRSPALAKILVVNLETDYDIRSLSAAALVDRVCESAGDAENLSGVVTHILFNDDRQPRANPLRFAESVPPTYKSARVLKGAYANPARPSVHSGYAVVRSALEIRQMAAASPRTESLDIYVDLLRRSWSVDYLVQEFLELPWRDYFGKVKLSLNGLPKPDVQLPEYLEVGSTQYGDLFSEVEAISDWLRHGSSDYLVTLTGDGEYRLSDILLAAQVCKSGVFGAVFGSRNQSQTQFRSSLRSAYGQRPVLYALSWLGAFVFIALLGLRFRVILSDPLTGFRFYHRGKLNRGFREAMERKPVRSAAAITRLMIGNSIEIAEVPVSYRTFAHFTRPLRRVWRGVRNLAGIALGT